MFPMLEDTAHHSSLWSLVSPGTASYAAKIDEDSRRHTDGACESKRRQVLPDVLNPLQGRYQYCISWTESESAPIEAIEMSFSCFLTSLGDAASLTSIAFVVFSIM